MRQLEVRLLGRFEVLVDSQPVPADAWPQRRAADLVKLLALARGHRIPRDQVLEALWPRLAVDAAASNLHKAASYARRALGDRGAVVLRGGVVELAPAAEVITDVALRAGRRLRLWWRAAARRPVRAVGAGCTRAAARAPPHIDAFRWPLGRRAA